MRYSCTCRPGVRACPACLAWEYDGVRVETPLEASEGLASDDETYRLLALSVIATAAEQARAAHATGMDLVPWFPGTSRMRAWCEWMGLDFTAIQESIRLSRNRDRDGDAVVNRPFLQIRP